MPKNKQENRGGKREGAGRKKNAPREYSDSFKDGLWAALERKADETGKTVFDVMADMLYAKYKVQDTTKASLFKIIAETMTVKASEKKITMDDKRSIVMLPAVGAPSAEAVKEMETANQN